MSSQRNKKMGRPVLPAAVRLDAVVNVRMTRGERRRLLATARERRVTAATLVRDALAREWGD